VLVHQLIIVTAAAGLVRFAKEVRDGRRPRQLSAPARVRIDRRGFWTRLRRLVGRRPVLQPLYAPHPRRVEIDADGIMVEGLRMDSVSAVGYCRPDGAEIVLLPNASQRAHRHLLSALSRAGLPVWARSEALLGWTKVED